MPDYKIIEWNEDNFDVGFNDFSKAAYDAGKYAFVSDVARLYVVHEYGGIYLDIDVELKDSLDYLEQYDSFFFFESDQDITTGLGFGARKNDKLVGKMLSDYSKMAFDVKHTNQFLCPRINTASVKAYFHDYKADDDDAIRAVARFRSASTSAAAGTRVRRAECRVSIQATTRATKATAARATTAGSVVATTTATGVGCLNTRDGRGNTIAAVADARGTFVT